VTGPIEQRLNGRGLHNLAGVHHHHPVHILSHEAQIVGDEEHGHAPRFLLGPKHVHELSLDGDVQGGGRLVCDQETRIARQPDSDDYALAHTAGEFVGIGAGPLLWGGDPHLGQERHRARRRPSTIKVRVAPKSFGDLLTYTIARVEDRHWILKNKPDVAAPDRTKPPRVRGP